MANEALPDKVLIASNFDTLDYNTIKFLEEGAKLGDLYVCVENSKSNVYNNNEVNRLYMIQSIKYVHNAQLFDNFESIIDAIKPDIVFDNKHNENRNNIAIKKNIKYMISTSNDQNNDTDEKSEIKTIVNNDKDKEIEKLKKSNTALGKLCNALRALADSNKETNDALKKQNIKLQKDLLNAFVAIGLMQEKLEQKENGYDNEEQQDQEEEEELESCSLCFGDVENSDLIIIEPCKHQYHSGCIYQCIQGDVGIYERVPICAVCDADGKQVIISNDIAIDAINRQNDADFLSDYQKIVDANKN
eukprot:72991_1